MVMQTGITMALEKVSIIQVPPKISAPKADQVRRKSRSFLGPSLYARNHPWSRSKQPRNKTEP